MEQFGGDSEALIAHWHPDSPAPFSLLASTGASTVFQVFRSQLDNQDPGQSSTPSARSREPVTDPWFKCFWGQAHTPGAKWVTVKHVVLGSIKLWSCEGHVSSLCQYLVNKERGMFLKDWLGDSFPRLASLTTSSQSFMGKWPHILRPLVSTQRLGKKAHLDWQFISHHESVMRADFTHTVYAPGRHNPRGWSTEIWPWI